MTSNVSFSPCDRPRLSETITALDANIAYIKYLFSRIRSINGCPLWLTANVDTCSAKHIINTVLLMIFGTNASGSSPGAKSMFNFTLPLGSVRAVASNVKYARAEKWMANCNNIVEMVYMLKMFGSGASFDSTFNGFDLTMNKKHAAMKMPCNVAWVSLNLKPSMYSTD